jgi:predicted unusual protein kinase regulating ubiquinone biosynthesis (AarF/ABC1/UbiB family)
MFGNKYDLSEMKLIGSGTIAQVYKVGDVCIKVRHPNVVREVMDAVATYDSVKNMFFMPVMLKSICDNFFEGLVEQLDFHREFNNGNTLKQLIHGETDGTNNLFIIPQMLDTSDECLVMEYQPSQSIIGDERYKINKHVLLKFIHVISAFSYITALHGFIHADMHMGNYGIRNPETPESMRIVLYDFGHMYDVRSLSPEIRTDIQICNTLYDFTHVLPIFLDGDKYHIDKMLYLVSEHNETGNNLYYQQNIKQTISYISINGIKLNKSLFQTIAFTEKTIILMNMMNELESESEYTYMYNDLRKSTVRYYYDKYLPYDDIKILKDKLGHLVVKN